MPVLEDAASLSGLDASTFAGYNQRVMTTPTQILQELCSIPTAPFVETRVIEYVKRFVAQRPSLRLSHDTFGNQLIELNPAFGSGKRRPRWVFTAHMDHPGFVARRMKADGLLEADFRGGVRAEFFNKSPVRFFTADGEIRGVVESHSVTDRSRPYPTRAVIRVNGPVARGTPGMWDVGAGRSSRHTFRSRVCDDLAGAAAAIQMMDELHRRPPAVPVALLLTRAEEEGFIGAIAASMTPSLLRRDDRLIAIECSAMQPYAPQGKGAIIRIGDRTSVFNSSLSYFLTQQATLLAKRDKNFQFQRALMPGGTCEATVYDVYGFTAASVCVALGNYHNMDIPGKKIAPEFIDLRDWRSMVRLFLQIARNGHRYEPGHAALKERLEKRFRKWQRFL